jgi:hypothetical protein
MSGAGWSAFRRSRTEQIKKEELRNGSELTRLSFPAQALVCGGSWLE